MSADVVSFTVYGDPQQKGSTRAFALPIKGTMGPGGGPKYRAVTTSANPSLKRWEQTVAAEAGVLAHKTKLFLNDAVALRLQFYLQRPPSVSARSRPYPVVTPDLDKLIRGAIDPLKGILFRDDAQVVHVYAEKLYALEGPPHLVVSIWPFTDGLAL